METENDVVITGVEFEDRKFTWIIKNFDTVRKSKDFINSQTFEFQAGETLGLKTEWISHLSESMKEDEDGNNKWIGVHVTALKPPANIKELNAMLRVTIKNPDVNGEKMFFDRHTGLKNFIEDEKDDDRCVCGWGWSTAIRQDADISDLPLVNGSLVIEIQLKISGKMAFVSMADDLIAIEKKFQPRFTQNLQNDLANLLENPLSSSDVETRIVSQDRIKFPVNRGILSARSPVFERMLQTDMKERRTGVITVSELGSKTIKVLLSFIYTGTLHKDWSSSDVIVELVYAADKYQIRDLVEFLDQALGSVCRKENAGKLLNLATMLGMKKARSDLFEFMKRQITDPEDFAKFGKDVNAKDII